MEIAVAELIDRYSVFLLDVYGVIMRGSVALPGAPEFIAELDRRGKRYYVMTNDASALPTTRAKRLQGFGLPVGPDRIITSGALLGGYFEANNLGGSRCVVLGPEDGLALVEKISLVEALFVMGDGTVRTSTGLALQDEKLGWTE